jgi:SAM dependent carboxyl methyltransferase
MSSNVPQAHQWNATMEGRGTYDQHSYTQAGRGVAVGPLLEQAARLVNLDSGDQPVLIADYGSSHGRNSLAPIRGAIGALRERLGSERAISVIHTDLPDNDFGALFRTLYTDPGSYLNGEPNVYASAVGRSFYEGVLPPHQVSLGWCSSAAHWPSCIAARVPGHYWSLRAMGQQREAFESQCARDWRAFLSLRARELKPTGRLVVAQGGLDEVGLAGHEVLHDAANDSLAALVKSGLLGAAERSGMVIAGCGRDRDRLLEPFAATGSFAGLSVEHCEVFQMPDTAWDSYSEHRDKQRLAEQRAKWFRAAFVPTLASQLDPSRSAADRRAFSDALEATLTRQLADVLVPMPVMAAAVVFVRDEFA